MTATVRQDARSFVRQAQLPPLFRAAEAAPLAIETPLESGKNQAAVVGSDVVAFVTGVTAERREAIANSALLAQLVATTKVPERKEIYRWYNEYFKVLENIGWATQEASFAEYTEKANGLQAHEAILKAATALLGPGTALVLVTATINALKSMQQGTPWFTIFNRETEHARTAHFQVTLVDQSPDGQFLVSIMAFGLEASSSITQVLFFKIKKNEATLKHYAGKVTINTGVLDDVKGELQAKLKEHAKSYIAALPPFA
jgi:hypothetical protein